jgi:hypothetical protein
MPAPGAPATNTPMDERFRDLPTEKRVGITLLGAVQLALLIAAQLDIQRRPPDQIRGPKLRWRLVCFINFIGPLSYFRWGRRTP